MSPCRQNNEPERGDVDSRFFVARASRPLPLRTSLPGKMPDGPTGSPRRARPVADETPGPRSPPSLPVRPWASFPALIILNSFGPVVGTIALTSVLVCSSCDRRTAEVQLVKPKPAADASLSSSADGDNRKKSHSREGYAAWYDARIDSLARRRAGKDELSAAHNSLRLGTLVRVTHLANGKSVIVRITDRGITKRKVSIDLCKEAAEQLGMTREGMARVRMEELPDDKDTEAPDSKATAAHP